MLAIGRADRFGNGSSASAASDSQSDLSDFDDDFPRVARPHPDSPPGAIPGDASSGNIAIPPISMPASTVVAATSTQRDESTSVFVLLNPQKKSSKRLQEVCERTPDLKGSCMEVRDR